MKVQKSMKKLFYGVGLGSGGAQFRQLFPAGFGKRVDETARFRIKFAFGQVRRETEVTKQFELERKNGSRFRRLSGKRGQKTGKQIVNLGQRRLGLRDRKSV